MVFHWDNIGFDGPVIAAPRAYEIPDNTVVTTYNGSQMQNLGYQLLDGTTGKAAGIYSPSTKINSLTFQNVNTSGITSATLTLNAFFNAGVQTANSNWGISYRFNGGTWRNRNSDGGRYRGDKCHCRSAARPAVVVARCSDNGSGFRKQHAGTASAKCSDGLSAGGRQYRFAFGDVRFRKSSPTPSPTPAPTVAISASPTSITSGKISTVTWSSTDATSCTAAGGWTGRKRPAAPWWYRRQVLRPTR